MLFLLPGKDSILQLTVFQKIIHRQQKRRYAAGIIQYNLLSYIQPRTDPEIRCRTLQRKEKNEPEEHLVFLSFSLTDQDSKGILALENTALLGCTHKQQNEQKN